jgi:hypothetical protein
MAKYTITHECGHTEEVALFGKSSERDRRIKWLESQPCRECLRNVEIDQAKSQGEEFGLPNLTGSDKQIAWAITIRARKVTEFSESTERAYGRRDMILADREKYSKYSDKDLEDTMVKLNRANSAMEWLYSTKTDSKFWIENRDLTSQKLLNYALKESESAIIEEECEDTKTPEIIIVPENPTELGIVIVKACEVNISVAYQKNDKFRETIKLLGYRWDSDDKDWYKNLTEITGSEVDRAAEVANRLLRAGFTVVVDSEEIKDKAITGQFEPECKRWIIKADTDINEVCIEIPYGNDDIYSAAKKISGAHWQTKRGMMVPVSSFEELDDFAECLGYKITLAANTAIRSADADYEALLLKRTTIAKPTELPTPRGIKNQLPATGIIDEDLRDEDYVQYVVERVICLGK